jgi:hypothetical protein
MPNVHQIGVHSHAAQTDFYSMTITSSASSGGGLPDFGRFQDEKIYTVYLDMRANEEDHTFSWILQYAVVHPTTGDPADRIRETATPPYATLKQVPDFSSEISGENCASDDRHIWRSERDRPIGAVGGEAEPGSADRRSFDRGPEKLDILIVPSRWEAGGRENFDGIRLTAH